MDELPVVDCLQRVLLVVHDGISKILSEKYIKQVSVFSVKTHIFHAEERIIPNYTCLRWMACCLM
jgi:hypothetical protein